MEAAAGRDRRRRREQGVRPAVEVPVEDMAPPGGTLARRGRASATGRRRERSIWPAMHPRLLELVRAAPLHDPVREQPPARRAAGGGAQRARRRGAGARAPRLDRARAALADRGGAQGGHAAGRSSPPRPLELGHRHGRRRPRDPDRDAALGRERHAADRARQPPGRGGLARRDVPEVPRRPAGDGRRHARDEARRPSRRRASPRTRSTCSRSSWWRWRTQGEYPVDELYALVRRAAPFAGLGRAGSSRACWTCSPAATRPTSSSGLRPRIVWDRQRGRGARARGHAAGGGRQRRHDPRPRALRRLPGGAGARSRRGAWASSTRRWCSRAARATSSCSARRAGASSRSPATACWSTRRPASRARCRSGRPTAARARSSSGARSARSRASSRRCPREAARERLAQRARPRRAAAHNLLQYLDDQRAATGSLPDDRTLVLERTRDEMGDWRLVPALALGRPRPRAVDARARGAAAASAASCELETVWSDDGIVLRLPERERPPDAAELLPRARRDRGPGGARAGRRRALFAAHFREAAARALLLPRRRPGQRSPLWMQRKRAHDLLQVAARYPVVPDRAGDVPRVPEDVFDLPALVELARARRSAASSALVTVDTQAPSPFAASLLFGYVANYLYDGDAPLAERRAQALSVDQRSSASCWARPSCASCSTAEALADARARAAGARRGTRRRERRPPARPAAAARRPLARGDRGARAAARRAGAARRPRRPGSTRWSREARAIPVRSPARSATRPPRTRGACATRSACRCPPGCPQASSSRAPDALAGSGRRATRARTARSTPPRRRGASGSPKRRWSRRSRRCARDGRVLEGEFRPGGHGREWCDADVLKALRRRSLAALRKQVEPAEPAALARLLVDWQGVGGRGARAAAARTRCST